MASRNTVLKKISLMILISTFFTHNTWATDCRIENNLICSIELSSVIPEIKKGISKELRFDMPKDSKSFVIQVKGNYSSNYYKVESLISPDGTIFVNPANSTQSMNPSVVISEGYSSILVPNTDNPAAVAAIPK